MGRSALGSYTTFIHSTFIHSRFIQLHSVYRVINEKKFCDPLVPREVAQSLIFPLTIVWFGTNVLIMVSAVLLMQWLQTIDTVFRSLRRRSGSLTSDIN